MFSVLEGVLFTIAYLVILILIYIMYNRCRKGSNNNITDNGQPILAQLVGPEI